jgi:uncharacterized protein YoxC
MEISSILQVALFLASVAIIVLVACLVPIAFQARRHLEHLALTAEQLKAKLEVLVQDSRELVRNVDTLSKRVNQQMDEVDHVVRTARQWTDRADRLVNEVSSAIEPSVFSFIQNLNLLRRGATTIVQTLLHRKTRQQPTKTGEEYV